ncbi:hypothetical protein GCM10023321_34190 [Pseudonocardia eucalypti]|uniref:LysM domain-containing protein n=1 Tax=Pseudonocardia eucalypti TaxID=648755 RepID=A0ABP9Q618_9PSEU|nr:LysM repeat protein [Pseudonocardia eucalypti]
MSPPSRDELREKFAVLAEGARDSGARAASSLRVRFAAMPRVARLGGVAVMVIIVLGVVAGVLAGRGGPEGQPGSPEGQPGNQAPAIASTPRTTERETSQTTGAPPVPGAPPRPDTPTTTSPGGPDAAQPPAAQPPTTQSPAAQPPTTAPESTVPEVREHVVRGGETLAKIALRYDVPFEQIAADSGITNPNRVRVGQRLVIRPKPPGVEVIQPGRTLSDYARRSGHGLDQLMRMNPQLSSPDRILAGGILHV